MPPAIVSCIRTRLPPAAGAIVNDTCATTIGRTRASISIRNGGSTCVTVVVSVTCTGPTPCW